MKVSRIAATVAAATVAACPVVAATASVADAASTVSQQDKAWVVAAHQSNLAEIAAGHAAEQKATTSAVRTHGALFISDHTRLDASLKTLARSLKVTLPSTPNAAQRASLAAVSAKNGPAFDKAWISAQIASHRRTLAAGKTELNAGTNTKVIAADKSAAPVVAAHLQMLMSTASARSVGTGLSAPADGTSTGVLPWGFVVGGAAVAAAGAVGLRRRAVVNR